MRVSHVYKNIYEIHIGQAEIEEGSDPLLHHLWTHYDTHIKKWRLSIGDKLIGQLFLRLMLSVKQMTGGILGDHNYLTFLENNIYPLTCDNTEKQFFEKYNLDELET